MILRVNDLIARSSESVAFVDEAAAFLSGLSDQERASVIAYMEDRSRVQAEQHQPVREFLAGCGVDIDAESSEADKGKVSFPPEFLERNRKAIEERIEQKARELKRDT